MKTNKKKIIITIDTEGDNLWEWKEGNVITTNNVDYLNRFQEICNEFSFKPVWLTNYEMILDEKYVNFITDVVNSKNGELGMHLHAWNSPPQYKLNKAYIDAPYLTEYPDEIMEAKIEYLTQEIVKKTGIRPISHRAGRWATNEKYFNLLAKYGYKIDCSVTPGINWEKNKGSTINSKGTDYRKYSRHAYWINTTEDIKLLEVPVTIIKTHHYFTPSQVSKKRILGEMYRAIHGNELWLRPNGKNEKQLLYLADKITNSENEYIMFMIHSSELMPGGSPTFKDNEDIENLYKAIRTLFTYLENFYEGITLCDFYEVKNGNM